MTAKIIAIENTKGGAGKSTITTNLACQLMEDGHKVLIIDRDPLRIASFWRKSSEREDYPMVVGIDTPTISRDVKNLVHSFDYILIDGAAGQKDMAASAIVAAHLVVIPVHPCAADVVGAKPVMQMIKERQILNDGMPICRVLVTAQKKGSRLSKQIHDLIDSYELDTLKTRLSHSVKFMECLSMGTSVIEKKSGNVALQKEMRELTNELKELLA